MKKHIFITLICFARLLNAMEIANNEVPAMPERQLYIVPGLGGDANDPLQRRDASVLQGEFSATVGVKAPAFLLGDFGQRRCVEFLKREIDAHPDHENIIIHATSQGTATALNYLAENAVPRVKAVILQSPLASGNSAIVHNFPRLAKLPLAYYWMPYCAKMLFPFYWPASSQQPIKSIDNIHRDIPIILLHSDSDKVLPYSGACAMYYRFRTQGHRNTYFVTRHGESHIGLACGYDLKRQKLNETGVFAGIAMRAILEAHGLKERKTVPVDLSQYQPDYQLYKVYYDELIRKENNHTRLKYAAITSIAATTAYLLKNKIAPIVYKVAPVAQTLWGSLRQCLSAGFSAACHWGECRVI